MKVKVEWNEDATINFILFPELERDETVISSRMGLLMKSRVNEQTTQLRVEYWT